MALLEIDRLTKTYEDGTPALSDLTLRVEAGEVCALLGPNGAGKSTTMNLLLGFIEPTSGSARIDGLDVRLHPRESKLHLGYIPEQVALYGDLDAVTNLRYLAQLSGLSPTRRECEAALAALRFPPAAFGRRARLLSKGMRQKVALAAVEMRRARVLIFDEPTSGLDPGAAADFAELLERSKASGAAVLIATHDLFRMRTLADRVVILSAGRTVAQLSRDELRHQDLEALYLRVAA
ncbi:MAG TPA: ABC transporter ATP-binding protein [Myxococcaceae bacterium]|jgi:ABC-2 type transport system ATP-binding protein